jgi:hypothetical protein
MCSHSIIRDLSIINHAKIIRATEEDIMEEEALEEVEDQ